jgi:hypothetical protein
MNGASMMLKSMGIDPEEIKTSLLLAKADVMTHVQSVDNKLAQVLANQANMDAKLNELLTRDILSPDERNQAPELSAAVSVDAPLFPEGVNHHGGSFDSAANS